MVTQAEKCRRFAALHEEPNAFIIPNPWDVGSARLLQGLGFKALATTSGGFAYAIGKVDGSPTLDEKLVHCRSLAEAVDIPLSADFEDGYAVAPEGVAQNVATLIETGVAGCSIEDFDRDAQTLHELPLAVERVAAAVEEKNKLDFPFVLTARCEHLIRGGRDLDEVIERLKAFEAAGADVLFAPGIGTLEDLKTVTQELTKPFNVISVMLPGAKVADLEAAGAKRISIGAALTFAAAKPIIEYSEAMLNEGSFDWAANAASYKRIVELLNA